MESQGIDIYVDDEAFKQICQIKGYVLGSEYVIVALSASNHLVIKNNFQWSNKEIDKIKREQFRNNLADLGCPEETTLRSKVLLAYDLVHCPELREKAVEINVVDEKRVIIKRNGKIVYQDD